MQNLKELLKKLLQPDMDFIIVGGFAGVFHGATQVTQDIDICLTINEKKIQTLRECLKDINPRHRMHPQKPSFLEQPKKTENIKNLYLETNLGILDVLSEIQGVGNFESVKKGAVSISLFGHHCFIMGLDDLIKVKKNLGRAKDIALYQELLEIKKKQIN